MQARLTNVMATKIAVMADFRMNSVKKLSGEQLGLSMKWISGGEKTLIAKYITLAIAVLLLVKPEPQLPAWLL
jgi:hypothetical protein